ncbi:asparagine synthase (glutamine-hydrolyzing) [Glaciecola sp. XM2]|uniref:asparagine synthase (glutamine-hydrolyzing) n=1 Tax=Glaciecola sp. XM2 TaxID=1914931 RepID=UPI001BDF3648|nr:asparagine synthase (glutamine-hydrolyzing) [Glaciecola sp. XM2]MBT1450662.1 asparagine synthase (glutamine-hydrolyzing) [Glaciecola sp. XM2]
MCGIAGIIDHSASRESLQALGPKMGDAIHHRGPDDFGYWQSDDIPLLFVHRRLSIQDLSPLGHQPMSSNSGRYMMVFNGEIYNFKQLTKELEALGHAFRGGSDTEVMLAAFEQWGIADSVKKFVGMFAFALFDQQNKTLTLGRDRMGEKPLYYGWIDKRFVFASELKSITAACETKPDLDEGSVSAYFRFGYIPSPYSIYKNIYKLEPGSLLELPALSIEQTDDFSPIVDDAPLSPSAYWSVLASMTGGQEQLFTNAENAVDGLETLLQDIIRDQSIADVPTGAFLSGGVDSTTVTAIMQSLSQSPIDTFTIGFKEKEFDEAPYAKAISSHLGTNHHELYISANDCLDVANDIARYWDEPFADSSQIPSYMVSKFAKEKVTVCLSGDGGDELFCGYNRYIATNSMWGKIDKLGLPLRKVMSKLLLSVSPNVYSSAYARIQRLRSNSATQANVGLKVHKIADLLQFTSIHDAYKYLMSYWNDPLTMVNTQLEHPSILDRLKPSSGSFVDDAMCWDQLGYLPDDNLVKGDRSSMASSLEMRLPLLDHRLVEYSWRLPLNMKFQQGMSKWALRQVLYRYVPQELIERPKMGFSVPVSEWLRGPLKQWAADMFFDGSGDDALLNLHEITRIWQEHQSGKRDHGNKLWTLAMFKAWQSHYF